MAPLLLVIGIGAIAAFALSQKGGGGGALALPPDPRELENVIIIIAGKKASPDHFTRGAAMALALGMPLTAAAIKSDAGLPTKENWVGTSVPVAAYIKQAILRRKMDAAKQKVSTAKGLVKDAHGAYKGARKFFGV